MESSEYDRFWTQTAAEQRRKIQQAPAFTLAERKRTSRGEQLLSLTHDTGFFKDAILRLLPLETLLRLPLACKQLRDSTNGLDEWYLLVITAIVERKDMLLRRLNDYRADPYWLGDKRLRALSERDRRHDLAVRRFFGLPLRWDVPTMYTVGSVVIGLKENRAAAVLANGTLYANLRNEIRMAINDRKKKKRAVEKSIEEFTDDVDTKAVPLIAAGKRLQIAINTMTDINKVHGLGERVKVHDCYSGGFVASELKDWEYFATDPGFATAPRPWVEDMIKRYDRRLASA